MWSHYADPHRGRYVRCSLGIPVFGSSQKPRRVNYGKSELIGMSSVNQLHDHRDSPKKMQDSLFFAEDEIWSEEYRTVGGKGVNPGGLDIEQIISELNCAEYQEAAVRSAVGHDPNSYLKTGVILNTVKQESMKKQMA